MVRTALVCIVPFLMTCCGQKPEQHDSTITIFAAASLSSVIEQAVDLFEARHAVRVRLNFAASSTLARQIEAGAAADIFISANAAWMDDLESRGLINSASRINLLSNRLVFVVPAASPVEFDPTEPVFVQVGGRIAMGDPAHVPAGQYARAALEQLGHWDLVARRIVPAMDARAALRLVETGEVDLGIVYASDARSSDRVRIVRMVPADAHPPIEYPAAVTATGSDAARAFLELLQSNEMVRHFAAAGFVVE